ncbi:cysteine-rich with EGF-like domain protein 2-B [Saccoglossus kowalevskii]
MMTVFRTLFVSTLLILVLMQTTESAKKKKGTKKSDLVERECETCRKIVKGFHEGIKATEKGHFGGGNTAWEERALGSYANSETRFVEITEKLCTSSEHECNRMFEEHEELLETWWKDRQEDENKNFLHQWLCIEEIKVCCPNNTYGSECKECPGGVERPCMGNGKCKGEGTRGGSGKCKCDDGYKGEICEVCKDGFFEETKNKTHVICEKCHEACAHTCWGPSPKDCDECKEGWEESDDEGCQDFDECSDSEANPCETNEYCMNTVGSFKCTGCDYACESCLGDGPDKCIKCKNGFEMVEGECDDIDECEVLNIECAERMSCYNNAGSYYCDCEAGYERHGEECISEETMKMLKEGFDEDEGKEPTKDENGDLIPTVEKSDADGSDAEGLPGDGSNTDSHTFTKDESSTSHEVLTTRPPQQNTENLKVQNIENGESKVNNSHVEL